MHAASSVLQKCLSGVTGSMHVYRLRALLGSVQCLLSCRRLILMDMARSWPGAQRVRAPLKRLDRLLSNPHLASEREALYAAMARWLIRTPHPLILIDWSDLHEDCRWQLLRASIPMSGRAVTVLEMIFPESMKGSPRAEKQFLQRLRALLPAGIKPIVITDAGFRAPWLRMIAKLGWCYVGRLRGRTRIRSQMECGSTIENYTRGSAAKRSAFTTFEWSKVILGVWIWCCIESLGRAACGSRCAGVHAAVRLPASKRSGAKPNRGCWSSRRSCAICMRVSSCSSTQSECRSNRAFEI